jgi:DNA polymerase-1
MFQCVGDQVAVLFPGGGKDGPTFIDAAEVGKRYGIEPSQVPDFIALRGDPSDGLPGAKGIGEKGAAELLREHGSLEALIELSSDPQALVRRTLKPRAAEALRTQAAELRAFKDIATLRPIEIERPTDAPTDFANAAKAARERSMNRLAERLERLGGGQ